LAPHRQSTKPRAGDLSPHVREASRIELTGFQAVREALRAGRRKLYGLELRAGAVRPERAALRRLAERAGVPVSEKDEEVGEPRSHQGIRLEVGPLPELSLEALVEVAHAEAATLVALDGVEDPQNLGAIARVADAAGAAGLLLTHRHAPPLSAAVSRASAGAIEWLPTARVPNLGRALKQLKQEGFWVFGADPEGTEELYRLPQRVVRGRRVVVLGAEGRGLRPGVLRCLDHRVKIPMVGSVASLNVATAAAVVLFEFARRDAVGGG
jgi:23S rRNA (guanosine2251-2'-O)-methyltransferase